MVEIIMKGEHLASMPVPVIRSEADLTGVLFFSKVCWKKHREEGRDRLFGKLIADSRIVEYTELITVESMLDDNPALVPLYPDSVKIGKGSFHHFKDKEGNEW
jgi:hypothetical protein